MHSCYFILLISIHISLVYLIYFLLLHLIIICLLPFLHLVLLLIIMLLPFYKKSTRGWEDKPAASCRGRENALQKPSSLIRPSDSI